MLYSKTYRILTDTWWKFMALFLINVHIQQTDPNGRLYLHQHKKGEEEKLRLHLVQFIKELNHTNYHGHEGKPKLYREFCSKKYTQHADATKLFESETAGDSIELLE